MSQDVLVSIIIDNYNYGRFLKDAIDSALNQTYHVCEVIVVDDGSTDDSRNIISSYGDQVIPIFKANGGQASAFNAGFAQIRGEIVIFLDSDDVLVHDTVRRVVEVFRDSPDVAKVMYRTEVIDAMGMRSGIIKPSRYLSMRSGNLQQYVLTFPFDVTWMATSGNAFAAQVLRQIFPMPEQDFRILADHYLAHLTPLYGPVISLDCVGAYYRVHGANNHEISTPIIDLKHIRQTITHCRSTHIYLKKFAYILELRSCLDEELDFLSVSYVANRFVSFKLEPLRHPIQEDTAWRLFLLGMSASFRRFDVSLPMKILFMLWFAAMLLAPRPLVHWLAKSFFFPETRGMLNKLLRRI